MPRCEVPAKAKWWELRIPMHVFLPIIVWEMLNMSMLFFATTLLLEIEQHFAVHRDVLAWGASSVSLLNCVSGMFIPVGTTLFRKKNLLRAFFALILAVGVLVLIE